MRRRWLAWKRRRVSRTRYIAVPAGTRILPGGLVATVRIVEIREEAL